MGENSAVARVGHDAAGGSHQAEGIAPRRIRTMRDLANLNLSVGLSVLSGQVGTREASTATGSFREVRRTVIEGQRIGYEKTVLDHGAEPAGDEAVRRRRAELEAELEALSEPAGR